MKTLLIIWTVIATQADGSGNYQKKVYDWRQLAQTDTAANCKKIADELAIPAERYRCVTVKEQK